jgi:hypothetical protein
MKYQREVEIFGTGSDYPVDAFVAEGLSMEMRGISSSTISALVLKENFIQLDRYLGTRIDGLVGYDIFSRFVVKIDYHKKRITLYEPSHFEINRKYNSVNLTIRNSKPLTEMLIQFAGNREFPAQLLVDTGASHALALDRSSSEKIELPNKYISASLGRGLSGEIVGNIGRIDKVELGENTLEGVITIYPGVAFRASENGKTRHGSIGGEMLKKFTVIFDFVHMAMHLKPNKSFHQPFEYNMSGIEFSAHGKKLDTYLIYSIRSKSAADKAGLLPGDVLVYLNNMPSAKLSLSRIYDKLNSKAGAAIDLTVLRDGKYVSKTMHINREF